MTLNRVPDNYFESTEESAFAPSRLVPGIEPSEDRMLQGRLFAYADTQMYRLGANYNQLPINRPIVPVNNNNQDGIDECRRSKGRSQLRAIGKSAKSHSRASTSTCRRRSRGQPSRRAIHKTLNFRQAGEYYRTLSETDKTDLITALSGDLARVTNDANKYAMLSYFYKADADYGTRLAGATQADVARVRDAAARLTRKLKRGGPAPAGFPCCVNTVPHGECNAKFFYSAATGSNYCGRLNHRTVGGKLCSACLSVGNLLSDG